MSLRMCMRKRLKDEGHRGFTRKNTDEARQKQIPLLRYGMTTKGPRMTIGISQQLD
jgi:hypothetical protein